MSRAKGRRVMTEETKDVKFYAINDGLAGRTPSNYLDMREREEAEVIRARLEGREPKLGNEGALPAATGTQLVVDAYRVDNRWRSNPSVMVTGEKDVDPVSTLPVSVGTPDADIDLGYAAQVASERRAQDENLAAATDSADETGRRGDLSDSELDELSGMGTNTRDTTV